MKKHNLCSNWQIFFMSDADKQTLNDIFVILIIKNLEEIHQILEMLEYSPCLHSNSQTDFTGVLRIAKQKCFGYSNVSMI